MLKIPENKIKVEIEIDGVMTDCTRQVPFPVKWNNLLDEQLDEAEISVLQAKKDIFTPLTPVTISYYNEEAPDNVTIMHFLVAGDEATEVPVGSGKFNHSLSLIEETKYLEGFICRSQGYVNSLGRIYVEE